MAEKTTLPKSVFAVEVRNHELLKLAYDAYLANNHGDKKELVAHDLDQFETQSGEAVVLFLDHAVTKTTLKRFRKLQNELLFDKL